MNYKIPALLSLLTVAVVGCANQQDRQTASGSYEYIKAKEKTTLKIPASVDEPEFEDDYRLPPIGENADPSLVGKKLIVTSPPLVIPLVSGSHIEEAGKHATIWIDQVKDDEPLPKTIWNSLINYLEKQGVGVASFDADKGVLTTDWVTSANDDEEDNSWFNWSSDDDAVEKAKFVFTMDVKPHGRTASLSAKMIEFSTSSPSQTAPMEMVQRRKEVEILNNVINNYEYLNQLETNRRIAEIRQGIDMEMGFDNDGNPAFVVDAKYDIAWPRLQLVLRKLGFNVKDLDKSNGLIFIQYTDEKVNWWEGWFSSDDPKILEYDDYRLRLQDLGDKTSITFMNNESKPFEAKQLTTLYKPFVRVMSEDGLDI